MTRAIFSYNESEQFSNFDSTCLSISGNNWIFNYFIECIVGDITPHDGVSEEDKHSQEMNAMTILVKNLPTGRVSLEFFNAFERYIFWILVFLLYFWIFWLIVNRSVNNFLSNAFWNTFSKHQSMLSFWIYIVHCIFFYNIEH